MQQANDNHQQWQGNNTHLYLFAVSGLAEDKAESCRDESVRTRGLRELLQWPLTLAGVVFLHPLPTQSLLSPCPLHFMSLHPPMLPQSLLHVVAPSELVSPVHSSLWASGGLPQVGVQGPSLPWSCRLYLRPQVPPSLDAAPLPHGYC